MRWDGVEVVCIRCSSATHHLNQSPLYPPTISHEQPNQAACYGVAFCAPGSFPSLRLAKVAHTLRVLRALRGTSVAWPLSAGQLEALGDAPMLQLLTQRRHHLLAMRIAEQLGVPRDKVGIVVRVCD